MRAVDLQVGARLLALDDARPSDGSELAVKPATITRLSLEAGPRYTYNLHVDGHLGYFAGGVLVHDQP